MQKQSKYIFTLVSLFIFGCSLPATAVTYYVSTSGHDNNPGTESEPWRTLNHASTSVQAGDTVMIKPGVYSDRIKPVNSGSSAGGYISFVGDGPGVIIDGTGLSYPSGYESGSKSYIKLKNLEFHDWGRDGIYVADGTRIEIDDCKLLRNGFATGYFLNGIRFQRVDHFRITDTVADNNNRNGIAVYESEYGLIQNCSTNYNNGNTTPGNYDYKDDADGINIQNSRHIMVRDCHATHNGEDGIDVGVYEGFTGDSLDIFVVNCTTHHNNGKGLCASGSNSSSRKTENVRFIDCRSYANYPTNAGDGRGFESYEGASDIRLAQCSIVNNKTGVRIDGGSGHLLRNNTINFSQVDNMVVAGGASPDVAYTNWYSSPPSSHAGTSYINADPKFANYLGGNLTLNSDSPNLNQGTFFTHTTSADSGTTVNVNDTGYFCGGWGGFIPGDEIQINSEVVRIVSVPSSSQITLDRTITWFDGDGVSLPYLKHRPDLGAEEGDYNGPIFQVIDELADLSKTYSSSPDLNIDTSNKHSFGGDGSRLKRTSLTVQYVVYHTTNDIRKFSVDTFFKTPGGTDFAFYTSTDGVNWSPQNVSRDDRGGVDWQKIVYTKSLTTPNLRYLKVEFRDLSSQVWSPQLARVVIETQ